MREERMEKRRENGKERNGEERKRGGKEREKESEQVNNRNKFS